MKTIKSLALAGLAAVMTAMPSFARVEPETKQLLDTLQSGGIALSFNDAELCTGGYLGRYRFMGMIREMALCPGPTVDAIDHATVRHEAWHAIQHCVNTMRQTPSNTPVQQDYEQLTAYINEGLSEETVSFIKRSYPQEHWWIEFEANLAELLTATEIEELFREACMAQ